VALPVLLVLALAAVTATAHGAQVLRQQIGAGQRTAASAATGTRPSGAAAGKHAAGPDVGGSGTGGASAAAAGGSAGQADAPSSAPSQDTSVPGEASSAVTVRPPVAPLPCPALTAGYLTDTPDTFPRTVALTFDDGPGPWTPDFLAVLAKHHVHATFFMVAGRARTRPDLVAQVVNSGNLVGNHSYTHPLNPGLSQLPAASVVAEIAGAQTVLTHLSGSAPCYFRGPGEEHRTLAVQEVAHRYGLTVTDTTRTAGDAGDPRNAKWDQAWRDLIVSRLTAAGAHPIVLMHDGHPDQKVNELSALDLIIDWYASRGYVFTDPAGRTFPSPPAPIDPATSPDPATSASTGPAPAAPAPTDSARANPDPVNP
jgi:peptidoglycan/xylan/chitin deacetylase (PgdA/CDA1 family)